METATAVSDALTEPPRQKYAEVNGAWPAPASKLPKPTGPEAIRGARLLVREGFRLHGLVALARKKRVYRLTSGNRYTGMDAGVFYVNPDRYGAGWHSIVHSISHYVHARAMPKWDAHQLHAMTEKHLIEYVVKRGWLDGALKRPEKVKPVRNVRAERQARTLTKLKAWEATRRRAETAIRKLKKQAKYYERVTQ